MIRHVKSCGLDPESTREPVTTSGFSLRKNWRRDWGLCVCEHARTCRETSFKAPAVTEVETVALPGKDGHGWSDWKVASGGLGV